MNASLRNKLKDFFKREFAESISRGLTAGFELADFNVNPFALIALASGVFGDANSLNMAKALIYPRVFGTSVTTKFGDKMQKLCVELLGVRASSTPGMDLEFKDRVSGNEVIMQLKAGPNTINSGDVDPIVEKMRSAYRLLRQNRAENIPTFVMGIAYGTIEEISGHYQKVHAATVGSQLDIPILIGKDLWHRITGDGGFYNELIEIFVELFENEDYSGLLEQAIKNLATEIEERYFTDGGFDTSKV